MEENGSLTKEAEAVMDFINSCKNLPAGVTTKMEMWMAKVQDVDENKTEVTSVKLVLFMYVMSFETLTKVDQLTEIVRTRPGLRVVFSSV